MKNKQNILIIAFSILFSSKMLATTYQSSCEIENNRMLVAIKTFDDSIQLSGNLKVHTFDKENRPTGTFNRIKKTTIEPHSKEYLLQDHVDWYVTSCKVNLEEVQIEIEISKPTNITIVNHSAPQTIVHEYSTRPEINIDFSMVNSFPIRTHHVIHNHRPSHYHRPYQHNVIIREREPYHSHRDQIRVRTIRSNY